DRSTLLRVSHRDCRNTRIEQRGPPLQRENFRVLSPSDTSCSGSRIPITQLFCSNEHSRLMPSPCENRDILRQLVTSHPIFMKKRIGSMIWNSLRLSCIM